MRRINTSFLAKLRMNRIYEEVDLYIEFEFHGLGFFVSHGDRYILIEPSHKIFTIALLKCLHYGTQIPLRAPAEKTR